MLNIKEKYSPDNASAISDHFYWSLKNPLFLKTQSSNANDWMKKEF